MNNEVLYEETLFPSDYSRQKVFYIICRVIIAIFIAATVFFVFSLIYIDWHLVFYAVWFALGAVAFVLIKKHFYNCYDLIFVSGEVRVIKVVNTKKRKKIAIFDSKDVFGAGRFGSETYEKFAASPDIKKIFVPTNKYVIDKEKYYICTVVDGAKMMFVLECSETFLKYVLKYCGKPVLEKEFK